MSVRSFALIPTLAVVLAAGTVAIGTPDAASAQDRGGPGFERADNRGGGHHRWRRGGGRMLGMLDTNMDRQVSRDEFLHLTERRFETLDTDGDGTLSTAELDAFAAQRAREIRERFVERLDANDDGVISEQEFKAPAERRFSRLDADSDGAIERNEMRHGQRWRRGPMDPSTGDETQSDN